MTIIPTISQLVRVYNLQNVHVPNMVQSPYNSDTLGRNFLAPDDKLRDSALGTPVYADLTLNGGTYTDNITGKVVSYPTVQYEAVIMTVDFAAKIIKTEIQGRDGTVKEYIGQDDAKVSVQGIICGWNGHYPAYDVSQLNAWRKAPCEKSVTSKFLQNLGIYTLVVEDCSLPQIAGGYSYQTFTMSLISDLPVELKITNNV